MYAPTACLLTTYKLQVTRHTQPTKRWSPMFYTLHRDFTRTVHKETPPMTLETTPQKGRHHIPVMEAARHLDIDYRTLQKMIGTAPGQYQGGCERRGRRNFWYVYTDQLPGYNTPPPPGPSGDQAQQITRLQAEVDDLRARLSSSNETVRLLLAAHAEFLEDDKEQQDLDTEVQQAMSAMQRAFEKSQSRNRRKTGIVASYREALAQQVTPGHLGDLTETHTS